MLFTENPIISSNDKLWLKIESQQILETHPNYKLRIPSLFTIIIFYHTLFFWQSQKLEKELFSLFCILMLIYMLLISQQYRKKYH